MHLRIHPSEILAPSSSQTGISFRWSGPIPIMARFCDYECSYAVSARSISIAFSLRGRESGRSLTLFEDSFCSKHQTHPRMQIHA